MAESRMFSKIVIDSDLFLDMPLSTQALYFHLAMQADDDGFVNSPRKIQRTIGASDDDMKLLIAKKFIIPFESGIIVISHWLVHNHIRKDRHKETIYQHEKSQLKIDGKKIYNLIGCQNDNQVSTIGIPTDNQMTPQIRVDKIRVDKIRVEEGSSQPNGCPPPSKPARKKYGEYHHVKLTDDQYQKLISDFGENKTAEYIRKVDEYCQQHGKSYKDYALTIRNWIRKDDEKNGSDGGNTSSATANDSGRYSTVI